MELNAVVAEATLLLILLPTKRAVELWNIP